MLTLRKGGGFLVLALCNLRYWADAEITECDIDNVECVNFVIFTYVQLGSLTPRIDVSGIACGINPVEMR